MNRRHDHTTAVCISLIWSGGLCVVWLPAGSWQPLALSALSSSPFHCALEDGPGQIWWTGDMPIPLQFASLYNGQEVFGWTDCLLDLGTVWGLLGVKHQFLTFHCTVNVLCGLGYNLHQYLFSSFAFIYSFTAWVVWTPQMTSKAVSSIFLCSHCPLGLRQLQACPFLVVIFSPLFLFALSSSPFQCFLRDGFGHTWWKGDMSIPLQFASLYGGQEIFV